MASSLPNSNSPNWNIPKETKEKGDQLSSYIPTSPRNSTASMYPLHSFSALGGGDAPLVGVSGLSGIPRVRSQLFTISTTRAVMTSVNYTSSTSAQQGATARAAAREDCRHEVQHFSSSASSSVDSDIEETTKTSLDYKPLNTDSGGGSDTKNTHFLANSRIKNFLNRSKRCIHGSFEDLQTPATRGKDTRRRRRSDPPNLPSHCSSNKSQMIQAANDLLVEENIHLTQAIQKLKRRLIATKVAAVFTLKAVRRRGKMIKQVEAQKLDKERQCAARLILHSLLLNSWRNTRRELDMRLNDNHELRKSVENFTLQVQVLRHVQTAERQKGLEKQNLIKNLNEELKVVKEENQIMKKEVEKMENELNALQASSQNLVDENNILSGEIKGLTERKDKLTQSLEWERVRSDQFGKENGSIKENLKKLESQLIEATEQRTHWQERARCSESEAWELQLHLESRQTSIQDLQASCEQLRAEKIKLIDIKSDLKSSLDRTNLSLDNLAEKNEVLTQAYESLKAERDSKANTIQELERNLENTKMEFTDVEKELLSYKLSNVRKRRDWGNALYFIVSPMDAVKRKLM